MKCLQLLTCVLLVFVCALVRTRAANGSSCAPINIARPNQSDENICLGIRGRSGDHHVHPTGRSPLQLTAHRWQHDLSLLNLWPNIALLSQSVAHIKNPICRRDVKHLMERSEHLDLWALKMVDSTARISSGVLNGNVNQLGDFDQCLSVTSHGSGSPDVTGKYCLAFLDVRPVTSPAVDELMHSYNPIVSNLTDAGHRIARFSTISWGFCIPSSCGAEDLEHVVAAWAEGHVKDVKVDVKVESEMCYTKQVRRTSTAKAIVLAFFSTILAMVAIGTFMKDDESKNMEVKSWTGAVWTVLRSFSLRRNWKTLFSPTTSKDDIQCLHGVRALNALALVIFHKSVSIMFNPYVNRAAMAKSLGLAWSVIGRTAIVYTDSFILLSGLLTSHGLLKELDKKGRVDLKDRYWARFCRIVPSLLALILFCTYVLVDLGSGPQWGLVVQHHSELCQSNMWRNFLFIHNYFGLENMCLTHTHQLGIEMQLFLVSPLLVWLLWRHRTVGSLVLAAIGLASTVLRYTATVRHNLSPVLYFGVSVSQMIDTANLSYILPSHRITVYVIGLALGYFLKRVGSISLNKIQVAVTWTLAFALGLYAMCGPYEMARRGYQYSASDAAQWNAGAPILWSLFLSIGIVLCVSGYGGKLNHFLSWRGFVVFTRLAYAVYLTQFPIFFYSVGSQRTAETYSPFMMVNLIEIGVILVISTGFTLLFDLPFQEIKKIKWVSEKKPYNSKTDLDSELKLGESANTLNNTDYLMTSPKGTDHMIRRGTRSASSG